MDASKASGVQTTASSASVTSGALLPARTREVFSRASPALIQIRVDQLLPFTTQRARQRIEALKAIFSTTPLTAIQSAHAVGLRDVVRRLRLAKSVRNLRVGPAADGVVGALCLPLTTCCAVPVAPAGGPALGLTGAVDGLLTLWDIDACRPLASAVGCAGRQWARVRALEAHPTAPLVFSATMFDRVASAWRIRGGPAAAAEEEEEEEEGKGKGKGAGSGLSLVRVTPSVGAGEGDAHVAGINRLAVDPSGALLASAGDDATLRLWDVQQWGQLLEVQDGYEGGGGVLGVAFHPDGALLATADRGGRVVAWDTRTGRHAFTAAGRYGGHLARATCVAWSPCGTRLASGGADAVIHLWDARMLYREQQASAARKGSVPNPSSAAPFALLGHEDVVSSIAFYANPHHRGSAGTGSKGASPLLPLALVSTSLDHTLRLWDMDTGLCVHTLDAGVPLYAHCRPYRAPAGGTKEGEDSEACTAAAIMGVGHSKYWFLWDVISASREEAFEAVVKDTDTVAAARHFEGLFGVHGHTPHDGRTLGEDPATNKEEDQDEDEEMLYLMRKPRNEKIDAAKEEKAEVKDNDESSDDEMALLRK